MKINVFQNAVVLDSEDDEGVKGLYEVTFDEDYPDVSESKLASMALDLFHTKICISCLDDFDITVVNDHDEPICEDEDHESYSFEGNGTAAKIEGIAIDFYGSDAELTVDELDCKYNPDGDGEHPTVTRTSWAEAVNSQQTASGYWDWVKHVLVTEAEKANLAE